MQTIELDGRTVRLQGASPQAFKRNAEIVFGAPQDGRATALLFAVVAVQHLRTGLEIDSAPVQAALRSARDLGVGRIVIDGDEISVEDIEDTPFARGAIEAYAFGLVKEGRAYAAAIANTRARVITFNGEPRAIQRQKREVFEPLMREIEAQRFPNEPRHETVGRLIGGSIAGGMASDARFEALLEMASDLGATSISFDPEAKRVQFGAFSAENALATAVMQGMPAEEIAKAQQAMRERQARIDRGEAPDPLPSSGGGDASRTATVRSVQAEASASKPLTKRRRRAR